jgi:hypothetical protein
MLNHNNMCFIYIYIYIYIYIWSIFLVTFAWWEVMSMSEMHEQYLQPPKPKRGQYLQLPQQTAPIYACRYRTKWKPLLLGQPYLQIWWRNMTWSWTFAATFDQIQSIGKQLSIKKNNKRKGTKKQHPPKRDLESEFLQPPPPHTKKKK